LEKQVKLVALRRIWTYGVRKSQRSRFTRASLFGDELLRASTKPRGLRRFAQLPESKTFKFFFCWYLCWYVEATSISKTEQNQPSDRHFDSVSGTISIFFSIFNALERQFDSAFGIGLALLALITQSVSRFLDVADGRRVLTTAQWRELLVFLLVSDYGCWYRV
jgi:hypothetical protein